MINNNYINLLLILNCHMNINVGHDKMYLDRVSASSSFGSKSDRIFGRNCTFCVKKGIIGPPNFKKLKPVTICIFHTIIFPLKFCNV